MSSLFFIGNGFDIAHDLDTSYKYFKKFLADNFKIDFEQLEKGTPKDLISLIDSEDEVLVNPEKLAKMLAWMIARSPVGEDWQNFEEALLWLPIDELYSKNEVFKIEMSKEDRDEACIILADTIKDVAEYIPNFFSAWIRTIDLMAAKKKESFSDLVKPHDIFINFNYTETLEDVYKVEPVDVFHVHGDRRYKDKLIIGHDAKRTEDIDVENNIVKEKLRDAIRALNKPVRYIMTHELAGFMISKNQENHLDPISDIYSIGFSFSNVDMPYIKEVLSYLPRAGEKNITWHLCDFGDDNKKKAFKQKIIEFGFKGKFGDYFKL